MKNFQKKLYDGQPVIASKLEFMLADAHHHVCGAIQAALPNPTDGQRVLLNLTYSTTEAVPVAHILEETAAFCKHVYPEWECVGGKWVPVDNNSAEHEWAALEDDACIPTNVTVVDFDLQLVSFIEHTITGPVPDIEEFMRQIAAQATP